MKQAAILATAWLVTTLSGWAADDVIFGGLGQDDMVGYYPDYHLLLVLGDAADNRIEVAPGDNGTVLLNGRPVAIEGRIMYFREMPTIAIHGGGGSDVIIGYNVPTLILCGGEGKDTLVWDNGGSKFGEGEYAGDLILCSDSKEGEGRVYGGAGLDILIGNTGGDRMFGDLGQDWLVGGTGVDSRDDDVIGGWGNDWISGGTGVDESTGGWGNDLLNADDVMTSDSSIAYDSSFTGGVWVAAGDIN